MRFILRWLAIAIATGAATSLIPGISIYGGMEVWVTVILFGLILTLINMSLKPILQMLSLPITILTLGIFYLIVNTFMLYVAAWVTSGMFNVHFMIDSFLSAFLASILISIVAGIINAVTGANKKS